MVLYLVQVTLAKYLAVSQAFPWFLFSQKLSFREIDLQALDHKKQISEITAYL